MLRPVFLCVVTLLWQVTLWALPRDWPQSGVIVLPDAGRMPLLKAIQDAKENLQVAAYKLTDDTVVGALREAAQRGVCVEILLTKNMYRHDRQVDQSQTRKAQFERVGIKVYEAPEDFDQLHYKMLVVDKKYALVGTGNWDTESFDGHTTEKPARDFMVTLTEESAIKELLYVFYKDARREPTSLTGTRFIWSPDAGREPFVALVASAKKSLWIYQQDIQDRMLVGAMAEAVRRGIEVRLLMMPFPFSKSRDDNIPHQRHLKAMGAQVRLMTHLYGHAKVMILDAGEESEKIYVGSANFYPQSLEKNRELGVVLADSDAVECIKTVFLRDWHMAQ
ncbi:MAG: hypothetical protein H2057_02530 [Alphaproteobacteria bacterium]|nr:hypothetical protein [Alphaproteobacteria bacterium]